MEGGGFAGMGMMRLEALWDGDEGGDVGSEREVWMGR